MRAALFEGIDFAMLDPELAPDRVGLAQDHHGAAFLRQRSSVPDRQDTSISVSRSR
jgi:hypothetical protein